MLEINLFIFRAFYWSCNVAFCLFICLKRKHEWILIEANETWLVKYVFEGLGHALHLVAYSQVHVSPRKGWQYSTDIYKVWAELQLACALTVYDWSRKNCCPF